MTTRNIHTHNDIETLIRRGAQYVVVVKYPYDASEAKGDVVSWHKSYDAAAKRCPNNGFYAMHELRDFL